MHDRGVCIALLFKHLCSCDVGHTKRSDDALASCIFAARRSHRRNFLKRNMHRCHPRMARTGRKHRRMDDPAPCTTQYAEMSMIDRAGNARAQTLRFEQAARSPSRRCLPVMPDRQLPGIRGYDRADAHGLSGPPGRGGESDFAMGRRPLSPWAPFPSPSRPAGHPRVYRADARGWLSLAQP